MTFDVGAYQDTVSKIRSGVQSVETGVPHLQNGVAALSGVHPLVIPPQVIGWVIRALNAFLDWVVDVLKFLLELIEGILAPFMFFGWAGNWRGFLKQGATDAQALMNGLPVAKSGDPLWKGPGADAYKAKVPAQLAAAGALADVCDTAGTVCLELAAAGLTLYIAVGTLILTLTGGLAAIGVEICSVLGIPAAPATAVATAGVGAAMIAGIVGVVNYITTLTRKMSDLSSKAQNNASFPGPPIGSWPIAVTEGSKGTMDDGTVTDGDADWSVPKR
jgi:hypothetical protein